MQNRKQDTSDWLSALTVMGRILISVPIIVSLIAALLSLFKASPVSDETIFAGGTMIFFCGVVTLIYVAIKRFQQGLKSKDETEKDEGDELRKMT